MLCRRIASSSPHSLRLLRTFARRNSTDATPSSTLSQPSSPPPVEAAPPLLATLRADLKAAMRSKDQVQLAVVRNLLAEIKNAQLSASPPRGDVGLLQIVRRARERAADTIDECRAAARADLVAKEQAQLAVLDRYATLVPTVARDDILAAARQAVTRLQGEGVRIQMGDVMRHVKAAFEGQPVLPRDIAEAVKEVLGQRTQ